MTATQKLDAIDAIAIGLDVLGCSQPTSPLHRRARAGLIQQALTECGYTIVPATTKTRNGPVPPPPAPTPYRKVVIGW